MRVRFTPSARTQFLTAVAYIRADNFEAAQRFRRRAEHVLRRLERFPHSGRKVPEFSDLPYREVIVRPYRFFYRLVDPEKNARNIAERGLSFERVVELEWDTALIVEDTRTDTRAAPAGDGAP